MQAGHFSIIDVSNYCTMSNTSTLQMANKDNRKTLFGRACDEPALA
jgi:hypothetical protein